MKKLLNKKILIIFSLIAVLLPCSVFASTVYIDTDHSEFFVGDTIMFSVRVDSEDKNINSVEGRVLLNYPPNSVSLTDINTSGSKFSLWPNRPLPSDDNTVISFSGGLPGGLNSKDAIIFNIVLKLQKVGQITLTPADVSAYLNDGRGTRDKVSLKNLVIDVLPEKSDSQSVDDWSRLISNDRTPPEPFEIYLGQDGSVFDGKKFLSFSATDEQSGIAYYEVRENGFPPVRSGNTYVLQEQDKPVEVTVIAYDSAGNARESVYSFASTNYGIYIFTIILIIVLVLIFRKMRKIKK